MSSEERDVDPDRLVFLMILGFVMEEIDAMQPGIDMGPGTKARELAERIAARIALEGGMMETLS